MKKEIALEAHELIKEREELEYKKEELVKNPQIEERLVVCMNRKSELYSSGYAISPCFRGEIARRIHNAILGVINERIEEIDNKLEKL